MRKIDSFLYTLTSSFERFIAVIAAALALLAIALYYLPVVRIVIIAPLMAYCLWASYIGLSHRSLNKSR